MERHDLRACVTYDTGKPEKACELADESAAIPVANFSAASPNTVDHAGLLIWCLWGHGTYYIMDATNTVD
jgi:hypothetical protein